MSDVSPNPVFGMALIAVIILALVLTAIRRTRWIGLTLAGLIVLCGIFFLRVQAKPSGWVEGHYAHDGLPTLQQQTAKQAQLSHRLAEAMPDAVIQESPDGSRVETYFDGMKVKQTADGERMIIRQPDTSLQVLDRPQPPNFLASSHGGSVKLAARVVVLPLGILAVLFVSFVLARRRGPTDGRGAWGAIAALLVILMGAGAFLFIFGTTQVHVRQPVEIEVTKTLPPRLRRPNLPAAQPSSKTAQESLEELWGRLAPLRINLDPSKEPGDAKSRKAAKPAATAATEPSDEKWLAAARSVLSKAEPMKQVQLVNAAKAILEVSTKVAEERASQAVKAQQAARSPSLEQVNETKHFESPGDPVAIAQPKSGLANAKPRPTWLDNPPKFVGNARRVVAHTDPYSTVDECYDALRRRMREIVSFHIQSLVHVTQGIDARHPAYVPPLEMLGITDDYIKREFCPEEPYLETVESSVGDMVRAHMLMEFQERQDEQLLDRWRRYARRERVEMIAMFGVLAILGLGLVYGLLKVDTWTRGYYTKRLFLGVPAAIIAVVVLLVMS